jgi:hypothetical protein
MFVRAPPACAGAGGRPQSPPSGLLPPGPPVATGGARRAAGLATLANMNRLDLALPLVAVLAVACGDDTTAMTSGTETTAETTTGTTEGPSTAGPTTAPNTTTNSPTTPNPTATDTDVTTSGPDPTGGPGQCGVEGDTVRAELVEVGREPSPDCAPLEFTGTRTSGPKGPAWELDGCPCGDNCLVPEPWTFKVEAPAAWLPVMPACPRIVVDRVSDFGGCRFAAVSIWDLEAPGAPAVYHAGHGVAPTAAAAAELSITPITVATCECPGCCDSAELWDLQFDFAGQQLSLAEGEGAAIGAHNLINFQSHRTGVCDAPLAAHWAIRKPG